GAVQRTAAPKTWGGTSGGNHRFALMLETEGMLSDAWLDAEYDNIADPLTVAEAEAGAWVESPGFDEIEAFGPVLPPAELTMAGLPLAPALQADMAAHHALFPHFMGGEWMGADIVAAQNGEWNDEATWEGGVIPAAGDVVVIPNGKKVILDEGGIGSPGNFIKQVYVDGIVDMKPGVTAAFYVETWGSSNRGAFLIGRAGDPFLGEAVFHFPTGAINVAEDPRKMGRGFMWTGHWRVYGAPKTGVAYTPAGGVASGEVFSPLTDVPADWSIGDALAIQATRYPNGVDISGHSDPGNQTEYTTISALPGGGVTIADALAYDHTVDGASASPGSEAPADMRVRIVNLTRNVQFRSPDGTPAQQRGHMMMMLTDKAEGEYFGCYSLGRTDKRIPANDYGDLAGGPDPIDETTNLKGRYAFHLHAGGILRTKAKFKGLAFYDTVGVGFANHCSNEELEDLVFAKTNGPQYMAEVGDEKGSLTNCVFLDHVNDFNHHPNKGAEEAGRQDWGQTAFLSMASREIRLRDIFVAGGNYACGIVWQTRGAKRHKAYTGDWPVTFDSPDGPAPRDIARYAAANASRPPVYSDVYSERISQNFHPLDVQN
ncbi:MAG: G8 domain-containing protein, partial [Amphiplicatus sp.]